MLNDQAVIKNIPEEKSESLPKYHQDRPFEDPVVRCNNCGNLELTTEWTKNGSCSKCENRRCRNVLRLNDDDYYKLLNWNVDADFLAMFERVSDK